MDEKTILITGATGFIGKNLVHLLEKEGHYILSAGRKISTKKDNNIFLDITDKENVYQVFDQIGPSIDVLIHLAAHTGVKESMQDPIYDANVNIAGTLNVFSAARDYDIIKGIYVSSSAVYGIPEDTEKLISEDDPIAPINMYGFSKYMGEEISRSIDSMDITVLRLSNVYGPGQSDDGGVIPIFINKAIQKTPPTLNGKGLPERDFVYVSDVCNAIYVCIDHMGGIYNISSGKGTSIRDVWNSIKKMVGYSDMPSPEETELDGNEVMKIVLSNEKARQELDWSPRVGLEDGIKNILDYKGWNK